jgi:hypothetical protein
MHSFFQSSSMFLLARKYITLVCSSSLCLLTYLFPVCMYSPLSPLTFGALTGLTCALLESKSFSYLY